MNLLTQNSDLKRTGIYAWTLPAHIVDLGDGIKFNTCPNAGFCAKFCYAKFGRWRFSNVLKAHTDKLKLVLFERGKWIEMMNQELAKKKYRDKYIRIHDGGDFFDYNYALDWLDFAYRFEDICFYTYTKEVKMFKELTLPPNFIVIYSFGGKQDHLIDKEVDRHSEVFPTLERLLEEGYVDIEEDDKLAAIHPNHKVGLVANNIPHLKKKQGTKTFGEWQRKE
jgi:hypothetical protein